jgi:hypothetical protein
VSIFRFFTQVHCLLLHRHTGSPNDCMRNSTCEARLGSQIGNLTGTQPDIVIVCSYKNDSVVYKHSRRGGQICRSNAFASSSKMGFQGLEFRHVFSFDWPTAKKFCFHFFEHADGRTLLCRYAPMGTRYDYCNHFGRPTAQPHT